MQTSPQGRQFIEQFEGLILYAYDDFNDRIVKPGERIRGTLTIGYGHTSAAGPPLVFPGQSIMKEEADAILGTDLAEVERQVEHYIIVPLTQYQFDACVSFQYNTGALSHPICSLRRDVNAQHFLQAGNDFLLYNRAGVLQDDPNWFQRVIAYIRTWVYGNPLGAIVPGLVRRRAAERRLFLTGQYT